MSERHADGASLSRATLMRCIADIHGLVQTVPRRVEEAYKMLSERELKDKTSSDMGAMVRGRFAWAPRGNDDRTWALAVGARLRACDEELFGLASADCGPRRDAMGWYCREADAYVVPVRRPRPVPGGPGRNNSFLRRGLVRHRVFPSTIGSETVDLTVIADPNRPQGTDSPFKIGGASFEAFGLRLALREVDDAPRFKAVDHACDGIEDAVLRQVDMAFADSCFAVVWPELAMPPLLRLHLTRAIERKRFEVPPGTGPRLWVMGSWHEALQGETVNRSHVADRVGSPRCTYDKISRYGVQGLGFEDIDIGKRVSVIITDEAIVGIAICKDFCMSDARSPARELPVDIVLVPSFGGASTAKEHVRAGHDFRVGTGGLSFVVQQMCEEPADLSEASEGRATVMSRSGMALVPGVGGLESRQPIGGWLSCSVPPR